MEEQLLEASPIEMVLQKYKVNCTYLRRSNAEGLFRMRTLLELDLLGYELSERAYFKKFNGELI